MKHLAQLAPPGATNQATADFGGFDTGAAVGFCQTTTNSPTTSLTAGTLQI